jgi:hypothetical protein
VVSRPRDGRGSLGLFNAGPQRPEQRKHGEQKHKNGDRSQPKLTLGQPERFVERTPRDELLAAS